MNDKEKDKKYLPITMGHDPVGKIYIDMETGEFQGKFKQELADILDECFGKNLIEVTFFGKPGIPIEDAQKKFQEFLKKENTND